MLDYNTCIICRRRREHDHHLCFGNANRNLSDADRLMIPVCNDCHRKIHDENGGSGNMSKQLGQLLFELRQAVMYGQPQEESRQRFRERYGKSYL